MSVDPTNGVELTFSPKEVRRYSLLDLLLLTTFCGVCLMLVLQFRLIGSIACFLGSLVLTFVVYPKWRFADTAVQRAAFDAIWGIIMPLVCFAPFLFDPSAGPLSKAVLEEEAFLAAAKNPLGWFFGLEMLVLTAWCLTGPPSAPLAAAFFGALLPGFGAAGAIGLVLFSLSVIATLFWGLGLLGFTLYFTAYVYGRAVLEAVAQSQQLKSDALTSVCELGGFMAVIGLSFLMGHLMVLLAP